ncbi:MAG: competence/damage-inducible protein A [Ignavibacteriales bacterium]|nr:competence/damage-inducible protein A [Ignavibacteriales bacterium]
MNAEIISIGDELLIGQVINSNQAVIAEKLASVGIRVARMSTVGDSVPEILTTLAEAWKRAQVLIITGGLGPTHDDLTREAVCQFFQSDLVLNPEALEHIRTLFASRGLPVTKNNEDQAYVPRGCSVIQNLHGTAPGYFFQRDDRSMAVLPGVPYEMKEMMETFVIPHFSRKGTGMVIRSKTLRTTGIAESLLAQQIGDISVLFEKDSGVTLAFLPSPTGVRLRISAGAPSLREAERRIAYVEQKIRQKVQKYIYGENNEELEEVVGRILASRQMTIAVAESCTGGILTDRITNISGSSRYFERGFIVYSNESKSTELGVPAEVIVAHGAVSKEVCEAMARGAREKAHTDIGISTTGIAGPTGGTEEKPVGLVWIGYSDKGKTLALRFNFGNDRRRFKERASQAALELVRRMLLKIDS